MRAFAPGSVTAIFAPGETADRSRGASVAIADGVVADVEPAEETERATESVVAVDGKPTDFEPVELALETLDVTAEVDLTAEIPIGRRPARWRGWRPRSRRTRDRWESRR